MAPCIVSGSANPSLARAVAAACGVDPADWVLERFPDGELRPAVGPVRGQDVYVVQPTGPPVNDNVVELMLSLDACRRAGAARITAVVPYFGYARQDRRLRTGEAIGARVVADALAAAGAQRLVVVDPHTSALESMCHIPVEMLSAVGVLAGALAPLVSTPAVLVAPDLGAVKLAERYSARLGLPVAVVRKTRLSATAVEAEELVGDVTGRSAVIVDDMISTGATIEAAMRVLLTYEADPGFIVAVTHGVLVAGCLDRLAGYPLAHLVLTDSLESATEPRQGLEVASIAPVLADAIGRMHRDEALDDPLGG